MNKRTDSSLRLGYAVWLTVLMKETSRMTPFGAKDFAGPPGFVCETKFLLLGQKILNQARNL